jgi:gliding motility-associated-like protein
MKLATYVIALLISLGTSSAVFGQAAFVPNQGQWQGDFEYQLRLTYGALFMSKDGLRYSLLSPNDLEGALGEEAHSHQKPTHTDLRGHVYDQRFIGAQTQKIEGQQKTDFYHNYFLGNYPETWRSNVPVFQGLRYAEVYPGVDIVFSENDNHLKYNWILAPGATVSSIKWNYPGADSTWIQEGKLIIQISIGVVTELLPEAYTLRNGIKTQVDAAFKKEAGIYGFTVSGHNPTDTLVIDPLVVFSSFTGSLADNWGFTATYDAAGNLYAGGIALANGYPTTTGAFQTTHGNPTSSVPFSPMGIDIGITKFNAQGNNLLYSTYIGGNSQDQPHSLFVDDNNNLFILGVTGSANFPVPAFGFDASFNGGDSVEIGGYSFNNGTDIYIAKLNSAGTQMLGGTFLGGIGNDGLNLGIVSNYGDQSRGEIVVDELGNVYITASTLSADFPTKNATQGAPGGLQDAVIAKLNSGLTTLFWSTYYGGLQQDAGYSIKVGHFNNSVYVAGSTRGSTLSGTANGYQTAFQGGTHDGYIAKFDRNSGALQTATYVGTNSYDQTFLLDLDKFDNVYVFGQTGGNYPVSPNTYFNTNAKQFIHKFGPNLDVSSFSTRFGRGGTTIDIVPIALNVDDCLNILLSGWGGSTNAGSGYLGGSTSNMPLTPDATQSTTDGSDLYFAVFGVNASSLKYATYYGGNISAEHVDGGTSRFDPRGNIYQAICAGCGGNSDFPTTAGAWSNTNNSVQPSNNCNMAVVKINFETSIEAAAMIDTNVAMDTTCNTLTLALLNQSKNANFYIWDFGNGTFSNLINPTVVYTSLGTYTIKLLAIDTVCDIKDSIYLTVIHDKGTRPKANFTTRFTACDVFRTVYVTNTTVRANQYNWTFGDGGTSQAQQPTHQYTNQGIYTITLIAVDTTCGASDTATMEVDFTNNIPAPQVFISADTCLYGGINVRFENDSAWYTYEWNFGGKIDRNKYPSYRYPKGGTYSYSLIITDTICNTSYTFTFSGDVERIEDRVFIPNAFTPNRDLINEEFKIAGNKCLSGAQFQIFDSWGNLIFETTNPFGEFWDGYIDGKPAQQDVYVYYFKSDDFEKRGYISVFY